MITLQFVRGAEFSSKVIAWFGGGIYSHVDAVLADGSLLGARDDSVGGQPSGVWVRPANYEKWEVQDVYHLESTAVQELVFYEYIKGQVGKPYDSRAIWGFALGTYWRDPDAWFCAELHAAAIEWALKLHLVLANSKITPSDLALVVSALGAKVDKH